MATQTLGNVILDNVTVTAAGNSLALDANLKTLVLQARGAAVQLKLGAAGDAEYFTLSDAQPQSWSLENWAGRTIYFDVASGSHTVEVMQIIKGMA